MPLQGFIDQAVDECQESLKDAVATGYLVSTCEVLRLASFPIAVMIGDFAAAERAVTMLVDISTSQNGTYWIILGKFLRGELEVKRGAFASGVSSLRNGFDLCAENGWSMRYPEFLTALAEGLAGLGRLGEASSIIDRALTRAERGGELICVPEILRAKGELILRGGDPQPVTGTEECFVRAVALAGEQGALLWELRAAASCSRLKARLGRKNEAREDLSLVYDRFTEGFGSAELRAAKAILDEL